MVAIAKVSFPRCHLNQAVAAYTGLPPVPPGVVRNGPFFQISEELVHAITIYTLPEGFTDATTLLLQGRYQVFATIPGFSCDLQEWREYREFLAGWVQ